MLKFEFIVQHQFVLEQFFGRSCQWTFVFWGADMFGKCEGVPHTLGSVLFFIGQNRCPTNLKKTVGTIKIMIFPAADLLLTDEIKAKQIWEYSKSGHMAEKLFFGLL